MRKMTLSFAGMEMIKAFEGCRLYAYKPVPTERYYTIGYGHYGSDVKKDMKITQAQAEELLRKDVQPIEKLINELKINFRQECFDALVSWIYNLGTGNFNTSTMKRKILSDAKDIDITDQMVKWVNSNGKPLLGLKRRRVAEANMWLQGPDVYYIDENNNIKR